MTLPELYKTNPFVLSYELFPPKTDAGLDDLRVNLESLLAFTPQYITCTYGAGGGTRDTTLSTLAVVQGLYDGPVASHLTCVGMTVDGLRDYLTQSVEQGIRIIVAIRGDVADDSEVPHPLAGGLTYANELVAFIRQEFPALGVIVGGYPEVHPEAVSAETDLDNLKRKVDAGADVVVTQLFYNNDDFFRFRDRCTKAKIEVPIVPGLLPVNSYQQIKRITSLCGAALPEEFSAQLERVAEDPDAQFEIGAEQATQQAQHLVREGVPGIHFYVLNKCRATVRVLSALNIPKS